MTLDHPAQPSAVRKAQGPLVDQSNFSVERLPGLAVDFEQFDKRLAEGVAPLCRGEASFEVEAIEPGSLFDTLNECHGLPTAVMHCADLDTRALVIFDRAFIDALAHVVFGAKQPSNRAEADGQGRPITRIDIRLVEEVSRAAAQALSAGFVGFTEVAFALERQQLMADAQILGRRDMPIVAARVLFEAFGAQGALLVLLPNATLLPIRTKLSKDPMSETATIDPRWAKQMKAGVSSAVIPVNGVLEELEMTLGEISELAVGRILDLRGGGSGRVKLESGGHNLFWCKLVQVDGRYTLEIEEPIEPEQGLLDAALSN
jgi:flagellar motor switch protein FliM